jgi:Fur family peroxide stress response transcriptional regulator
MHIHDTSSALDHFYQKCKYHNLKITPQRVAIYKELLASTNHPSADDVFKSIRMVYPTISFDTVNRTLLTFSKIQLIDVVESYSGSRRFDSNRKNHHHIHCIHCGKILDFDNTAFDSLELPAEIEKKNRIVNKRVTINVICSQCNNNVS